MDLKRASKSSRKMMTETREDLFLLIIVKSFTNFDKKLIYLTVFVKQNIIKCTEYTTKDGMYF